MLGAIAAHVTEVEAVPAEELVESYGQLAVANRFVRLLGLLALAVAAMVCCESVVVAAAGALAGVPVATIGLAVLERLDPRTFASAGLLPSLPPLSAIIEGGLVALLAGTIGALAPVHAAARVHPARTLRQP